MNKLFIYCVRGKRHLIMSIWSIKSLLEFGHVNVLVIVSNSTEKKFINKYIPSIKCQIIKVSLEGYKMWAWRPFVLKKLKIKNEITNIVITDADILWFKNPSKFLIKFKNQCWFHKITYLDPNDFSLFKRIEDIPPKRQGLITMLAFLKKRKIKMLPNFHINCGLFMVSKKKYKIIIDDWVKKIKTLKTSEMLMTEALLSLTLSDLGLKPISDEEDIKYLPKKLIPKKQSVLSLKFRPKKKK